MKSFIREILPPILLHGMRSFGKYIKGKHSFLRRTHKNNSPDHQDLDVYWDPAMVHLLEIWGDGNVWNEIQFLMINCKGSVLDFACGTGKTIEILSKFPFIEVYGCDISDYLIQKAIERGINKNHLMACDATKTNYPSNYFDYAYSIGSLEHFTEDGIHNFITENHRIIKYLTYHFIPVSKSGKNEGWIKTYQSYFNNSTQWWLDKFNPIYKIVYTLDSVWCDNISDGKWFVCMKGDEGISNKHMERFLVT